MQALLDEWRAEAARKPLGMTEAEACQVLEVSVSEAQEVDDETLKAAYRCCLCQYRTITHTSTPTPKSCTHVVLWYADTRQMIQQR